jgi:hypothetical protein
VLGGDRGYRPSAGPCAAAAASARGAEADRTAHRLLLKVATLRDEGVETHPGLARALTERGVRTARGSVVWTHTTVARLVARVTRLTTTEIAIVNGPTCTFERPFAAQTLEIM